MKSNWLIVVVMVGFVTYGNATIVDTIQVGYDKTVYLFFDAIIKDSDFGHPDVLGEVKGNKMILRSAVAKGFPETNINIETETGVYIFVCVFRKEPKKLLYQYNTEQASIILELIDQSSNENTSSSSKVDVPQKKGSSLNGISSDLRAYFIKDCEYLMKKRNEVHEIGIQSNKLVFSLGNMFVNDKYMYFKVDLRNEAYIKYDIDFFKFVVRNKVGKMRKAAVQDEEKTPLFVYNNDVNIVDGKNTVSKIFVFEKFTMDDKEFFFFEVWETLGDRKVEFKIPSKSVLGMRRLY